MAKILGGYKTFNLKKAAIDTTGVTVAGLYDWLEANMGAGKPLALVGVACSSYFGSQEVDTFITPRISSGDFVLFENAAGSITVDDDDLVKYTAVEEVTTKKSK